MLPAGFRGRWWLIVAGRRWVGRGWVGGGVGGMGGAGMGGGLGIAARIPNRGIGGAGNGVRETGIRKRIRGIAESRNRGFGIDGCAHLCARCVRNSANSPPGNAESGPGNPPETPELANNYGFRSLAGTLAPEL